MGRGFLQGQFISGELNGKQTGATFCLRGSCCCDQDAISKRRRTTATFRSQLSGCRLCHHVTVSSILCCCCCVVFSNQSVIRSTREACLVKVGVLPAGRTSQADRLLQRAQAAACSEKAALGQSEAHFQGEETLLTFAS